MSMGQTDVEGVSGVDVRPAEGRVLIKHRDGAPVANMVAALRDAGYEASQSAA